MSMNTDKFIYRSIAGFDTVEEGSRTISGTAIVFNSWSKRMINDEGKFYNERILPEAVSQELIDNSDIIMNLNHDDEKMLARWNKGVGTLSLELREDGLHFSFEAPTTALGDEVLYNVRNGNLFECSFRFYITKSDMHSYKEDGEYRVDIKNIRGLADCSIVTHGAYGATSVYVRNEETKEEVELSSDEVLEEVRAAEEEDRKIEEARLEEERKSEILKGLDEKLAEFYKNI